MDSHARNCAAPDAAGPIRCLVTQLAPLHAALQNTGRTLIRNHPQRAAGLRERRIIDRLRAARWCAERLLLDSSGPLTASPVVGDGLKEPFACSASMKGLSFKRPRAIPQTSQPKVPPRDFGTPPGSTPTALGGVLVGPPDSGSRCAGMVIGQYADALPTPSSRANIVHDCRDIQAGARHDSVH
jgi:hypothetical protein